MLKGWAFEWIHNEISNINNLATHFVIIWFSYKKGSQEIVFLKERESRIFEALEGKNIIYWMIRLIEKKWRP